jgi:hypothetical protein
MSAVNDNDSDTHNDYDVDNVLIRVEILLDSCHYHHHRLQIFLSISHHDDSK